MRRFALVPLLIGLSALPALPAAAAPPAPASEQKEVRLELDKVPFREALARLFRGTEYRYEVMPGVPDTPITLRLSASGFEAALITLVRQAGMVLWREGRTFHIGKERPSIQYAPTKVTLQARGEPFGKLLEGLGQKYGLQFALDPLLTDVPVTVDIRDVEFKNAVQDLVRAAGATHRWSGDMCIIENQAHPLLPLILSVGAVSSGSAKEGSGPPMAPAGQTLELEIPANTGVETTTEAGTREIHDKEKGDWRIEGDATIRLTARRTHAELLTLRVRGSRITVRNSSRPRYLTLIRIEPLSAPAAGR